MWPEIRCSFAISSGWPLTMKTLAHQPFNGEPAAFQSLQSKPEPGPQERCCLHFQVVDRRRHRLRLSSERGPLFLTPQRMRELLCREAAFLLLFVNNVNERLTFSRI